MTGRCDEQLDGSALSLPGGESGGARHAETGVPHLTASPAEPPAGLDAPQAQSEPRFLVFLLFSLHSLFSAVEVDEKLAAELDAEGTDTQHAGQGAFRKKKRSWLYRTRHYLFLKYKALLRTL